MDGMGWVGVYWLALIVVVLWMMIRIGRSSSLIAGATFVFWPVSVFHLISSWGDPDTDIRVPFLLCTILTALLIYNANDAVNVLAVSYTPEELEELRRHDPAVAAEIQRRQLEAMGIQVVIESEDGKVYSDTATSSADALAGRPVIIDPDSIPAAPRIREVPVNRLNFRTGNVGIGPAFATLVVPSHFRFISVEQLGGLARAGGVDLDEGLSGWVVHERSDLRSTNFWFVEVRFHAVGFLAAPAPPLPAASPGDAVATVEQHAESRPSALTWNADRGIATWAESSANGGGKLDLCSTRLTRHGALVYCVPDLDPARRELGLRVARLMASRTWVETGWSHANFVGSRDAQTLDQWIAGREPIVAESENETAKVEEAVGAEAEAVETL